MDINRANALKLWDGLFGPSMWATDFHGNVMYRDAYGDSQAVAYRQNAHSPRFYAYGKEWSQSQASWLVTPVLCGWNIYHVLPKANGGTDNLGNLIPANIITSEAAAEKTEFSIDGCNYQVVSKAGSHSIVLLNPEAMNRHLNSPIPIHVGLTTRKISANGVETIYCESLSGNRVAIMARTGAVTA